MSAGTPEATRVGMDVLERGGNAVDAAVAVSLALGVTEPGESGLGGQVVMLIRPAQGEPLVLDGTTRAPRTIPDDTDVEASAAWTTAPTAVRVLETAWRSHGSGRLEWSALVAPAARLARDGWPLGRFRQRSRVREYPAILASPTARALLLNDDHSLPSEGTRVSNPALARTLRVLGEDGPAGFYGGDVAAELVAAINSGGGVLTASDLGEVAAPEPVAPLRGEYRGWEVLTLPDPHRGEALLRALRLLEAAPSDVVAEAGVARSQWLAEALLFAFSPGAGSAPSFLASRPPLPRSLTDTVAPPPTGRRGPGGAGREGGGETTSFTVIDREGTTVVVSQSLGGTFGSTLAPEELGFFLNRYLRVEGDSAGPGLRDAGEPAPDPAVAAVLIGPAGEILAIGSPGGSRGVSALAAVIVEWVDGRRSLREAVEARRVHVEADTGTVVRVLMEGTSWSVRPGEGMVVRAPVPDSAPPSPRGPVVGSGPPREDPFLRAEAHRFFGDSVAPLLRARGFRMGEVETGLSFEGRDPWYGRVHAAARLSGGWSAAADPRGDGEGETLVVTPAQGPPPGS